MKHLLWIAGAAVCVCLAACETVRRTTAAVALPFAAVGDTLLLPVQGMGAASDALLEAGTAHRARMREENRSKITADASAASAVVYELPGYVLYPFSLISPSDLYPMTSACWDALQPATTNPPAPHARARTVQDEQFEEW